jgi:hypothetical protein
MSPHHLLPLTLSPDLSDQNGLLQATTYNRSHSHSFLIFFFTLSDQNNLRPPPLPLISIF